MRGGTMKANIKRISEETGQRCRRENRIAGGLRQHVNPPRQTEWNECRRTE